VAGVDAEDVVVEAEEDVGAGKASSISALEIAFNKVLHGIKNIATMQYRYKAVLKHGALKRHSLAKHARYPLKARSTRSLGRARG
jgi:hypothetical protein